METWKDIPFNQDYQISNEGRVKSKRRKIHQKNGHPMTFPEVILEPVESDGGYLYVTLCDKKTHRAYKIHRLVALTFLPNDNSKRNIVHHIDHNRKNNYFENLQWVTQKENVSFNRKSLERQERDWHGRFCKSDNHA